MSAGIAYIVEDQHRSGSQALAYMAESNPSAMSGSLQPQHISPIQRPHRTKCPRSMPARVSFSMYATKIVVRSSMSILSSCFGVIHRSHQSPHPVKSGSVGRGCTAHRQWVSSDKAAFITISSTDLIHLSSFIYMYIFIYLYSCNPAATVFERSTMH